MEFGTSGCGDEDDVHGTEMDEMTTTVDVSVDDDPAAATDDDEDDAVLQGSDDEEPVTTNVNEHQKPHDRVSLMIDDSDVIAAPSKPGVVSDISQCQIALICATARARSRKVSCATVYLARSAKVAKRAICFTDRNFYLFFSFF